MSNILVGLYVFIIFYNPLYPYIPYGNYADEIICLILMGIALAKWKLNGTKISKNKCIILILGSVICAIGIVSNLLYGYMQNISVIFRDFIATFKFFITFYSMRYVVKDYYSEKLKTKLMYISKVLISLIFMFAILSLFSDIGMGNSVRHGMRSFKFIYSHYTYLVHSEVILLATIMCEEKKNLEYYVMSIITLFLTLRTKAFLFIVIVVTINFLFYLKRKKRKIALKEIFKLRYIVPMFILGVLVVYTKISEYMSWGVTNSIRIGLHVIGLRIMILYFPLGTGFGTFGTNLSYASNSVLYHMYSELNYTALLNEGYATISDVYWPSIYVQFGLLGCVAYIGLLIEMIKEVFRNDIAVKVKKSILCVWLYLVTSSMAEAVFSNETGVFFGAFMAILMCFPLYKKEV